MKLIIDIDENVFTRLFDCGTENTIDLDRIKVCNAIRKGTPIPDNATNEDVAELVWGFKPRENTCIIPKTECNGNPAECDGCSFDDWWKEQYQKGGK